MRIRNLGSGRGTINDCIVVFNKDKVTEYGPYVGELRTRYNVFSR